MLNSIFFIVCFISYLTLPYLEHYLRGTFVSFNTYSLPNYDFSPKGELIKFEDTRSIVMNDFLYTLKFDNSPCGEISTSPTQMCVLQTGSQTSYDSMFRWRKCFKEARTKTVLGSHCT